MELKTPRGCAIPRFVLFVLLGVTVSVQPSWSLASNDDGGLTHELDTLYHGTVKEGQEIEYVFQVRGGMNKVTEAMGVGIVEWRAAIGTFSHPASWRWLEISEYTPFSEWSSLNEFAYRLLFCILVWTYTAAGASAIVCGVDMLHDWLITSGRITTEWSSDFDANELVKDFHEFAPWAVRVTSAVANSAMESWTLSSSSTMTFANNHSPHVSRLLQLSGDIELNPGPDTRQTTLTKSGELRSADETVTGMLRDIQDNMRELKRDTKALTKKMERMETQLNKMEEAIDDVRKTAEENKKKLCKIDYLEEDIVRIERQLKQLNTAKAEMEDQSKRNNVIFRGVKEVGVETWEETERKIKTLLSEKMKIEENIEFERVHRMKTGTNMNRPIVAMCCSYKDKEKILSKGKELRGTDIFVDEHFSKETGFIRKKLFGKRKELMAQNIKAFSIALRVEVNSSNALETYPVMFVVTQQEGIISWKLPLEILTVHKYDTVARTLCPMHFGEKPVNDVLIRVTCSSQNATDYSLIVTVVNEFEMKLSTPQTVMASPSQPQCPVFDLLRNVKFIGMYQTVTMESSIHVQNHDFDEVFIVIVVHPSDQECTKLKHSMLPDDKEDFPTPGSPEDRIKNVTIDIIPMAAGSTYWMATLVVVSFFIVFYILYGIILLIKHCRSSKEESNIDPNGSAARGHSLHAPEDSLINREDRNNIDRVKPFLSVADLCKKSSETHNEKYKLYCSNLIPIAIFYALPVIQLVFAYQNIFHDNGDEDICYYNFLCSNPLGVLSSFNNVFSNIGYVLLGILFLIITRREEKLHQKSVERYRESEQELGLPRYFGIFYAIGIALIMEGIHSACYHVCPSHSNFQFGFWYTVVLDNCHSIAHCGDLCTDRPDILR
ncbi:uncharacterized protein [Ptychodera flava]|uniref:uncharacterized protein n=1 Tax=Ptychodera flava TaxID=63121 RepID=UPI003969C830